MAPWPRRATTIAKAISSSASAPSSAPKAPVGAELDLHCHITDTMVREATVLVAYKEYPACRYPRPRRRALHLCRRRGGGQDAAGHGRLRLPHDRHLPHHRAAAARLCRPDVCAGGQGRRPLGFPRPQLSLGRCRRCRRQDPGRRRWRPGQGGEPRAPAGRGALRGCARRRGRASSPWTRRSTRRSPSRAGRW